MFSKFRITACFLLVLGSVLRADYGDVPAFEKFDLKLGVDWRRTSSNFGLTRLIEPLTWLNQAGELNDFIFWLEPEYGIAEDWSLGLKVGLLTGTLESTGTLALLATGTGITDAWVYSKWAVLPGQTSLTIEAAMKAPTGTYRASSNDELVTGEGAFDLGLKLHGTSRFGLFRMFVTPGLLFRFGGYATAFTGDAAIQLEYIRGYVRAFTNFIYSFSDSPLYDSTLGLHSALGTGGSYTRLAGSPTLLSIGGKLGILVLPGFALETYVTTGVYGSLAPLATTVGLNAAFELDFAEPKKSVRIRELPFNPDDP